MEVEFTAAPEWTDELTFKYYILFNGKLLTGEVTHTNIPAGRDDRSVMYISPRTLARFANNRPITANMFQNFAVQIVQQGAVKDELSLARAPGAMVYDDCLRSRGLCSTRTKPRLPRFTGTATNKLKQPPHTEVVRKSQTSRFKLQGSSISQ